MSVTIPLIASLDLRVQSSRPGTETWAKHEGKCTWYDGMRIPPWLAPHSHLRGALTPTSRQQGMEGVCQQRFSCLKKTLGYCWPCMDPPPMSRRNHPWNVSVQMQSCIRPP